MAGRFGGLGLGLGLQRLESQGSVPQGSVPQWLAVVAAAGR